MNYLTAEIENNILKLENSIAYQTGFIEDVDSIINQLSYEDFEEVFYVSDKFKFNKIPNYRGLSFAKLDNIFFESAKINGVFQEININTTQLIARLYQKQNSYTTFSEQVEKKLRNIDSKSKNADVLAIFELLKYDGLETEQWLVKELETTKDKIVEIIKNKDYLQ